MKQSAAEALKAAIRRAIPVTIILVVFGVIAMNVLKQLQGPQFSADARVALQTVEVGALLTGVDQGFVDPEREVETALALARSSEVYRRAARRLGGDRSASELRGATTVDGREESDIVDFTAAAGEREEAIAIVNAVVTSYVEWRADINGRELRTAIGRVQARLTAPDAPKETLRQDLERLRTLEALNSGGATVIERPLKASQVSPSPVRDSMLGGAIGLVLALLLAAAREALNTRIRSEGDVEDALGKPVLATIQTLPRRVRLVTIGRHETRFGDTYGLLAANLMQMPSKRSGPLVLAVTSAVAGEGKTTTASNLAIALALRGQNVLLADFDLRKPSVAPIFRIPASAPGVLQLIDGRTEPKDAVWAVPLNGAAPGAQPLQAWSRNGGAGSGGDDEVGSLWVVPSGGHQRGARAVRSSRLPKLLEQLSSGADIVILDTPPALATVEMAELAPLVDYVLVVVRHGRVTRRSLQTLGRQAETWRTTIAGAVLTDSPAESDDYYYAEKA